MYFQFETLYELLKGNLSDFVKAVTGVNCYYYMDAQVVKSFLYGLYCADAKAFARRAMSYLIERIDEEGKADDADALEEVG